MSKTMATGGLFSFQRVLESFKSQLGPSLAAEFEMTSLADLKRSIAKIERKQATERRLQNMGRLSNFVEIMDNYGKVIEIFLNVTDVLAFVWGPMKFLLQVASSVSEAFNELLTTYKIIGESLPLLEKCEGLLDGNPCVQQALESMFHDILEFHRTALTYFRKPMWKQLFQATWSTYKMKFGPIVDSLKRHKQLFGDRVTFTQLEEIRSIGLKTSEDLEKQRKSEEMSQLREVQCWLNGADVVTDQDTLTRARSGNPQAGTWLLRHELFRSWKERNKNPILWVNGIPGAGKTVLASIMIDDCLKIQSKCTIWFYFKNGDMQKDSFLSFACSVISQLLEKNTDLLPYVHGEMCRKGKRALSSESLAKELLELMIRNSGEVCIVVDGLDECSKVERRKVIEWMRLVIEPSQHSTSDYIQCVFISQRDGITAKALRDVPSLQINTKNTHNDIFAFVSSRGLDIKNKFHLSDETMQSIVQLVMEKAGGMFLLAKLVMNNLFSQISPVALFKELEAKEIPTQIEEAYERILNNILVEHSLRAHALQLLAWLVCAKRQLWWREVQGAVSIDLETEDVDPESRQWILDFRDICDSLVEVRTDGSLELVHSTAKLQVPSKFLVQSKLVNVRREELNMARLCVGYLALPGFETSQPDESILVLINHGYYSFLDYAACFWSLHLQEGLKCSIDRETAVSLVEVLSKFLESHYRSSEKEINIPSSAHELERRLQEHDAWSASGQFLDAFVSTQKQLCCFSEDATSNDSLDIPCVIARIRKLLETTASGNQDDTKVDPKDELFCKENFQDSRTYRMHKCIRPSPFQRESSESMKFNVMPPEMATQSFPGSNMRPPSSNPAFPGAPDTSPFDLDFSALENPDVLDNFDFDTFLNTDADATGFGFDPFLSYSADGVETGAREL
ncbi:hypothetical protein PEX2_067410 [Penicillium expansum]|uniref:Uncharacterized protein n=1 Tax=Penicillium expansum TaxID=27334 RepID=A0A0A2JTU4_PENEN|nr:hypothetical protein PEX2_067410 [Penicillium expansum]KGO58231.1 hypothetical protein PEX2_067410 [Penicillium expansum]